MFRLLRTTLLRGLIAAGALLCAASPRAEVAPPPQGVVNLGASASEDVPRDVLSLVLSTGRDAGDAGAVQQQLKQALDAALVEARKVARPGQVDVRAGSFSVAPRYTDKGAPNGWHGSAELVVEGRDMAAIGQLAGRISSLTIARAGYDISRELRAKTEGDVTAQAIALFQSRAAECARQFGYTGYSIREVSVNPVDAGPGRPMAAMAMEARSGASKDALPVEPGRGTITVNVSGSVQLSR